MTKAYMSKFGDWTRAGVVLQALNVNLHPAFIAQLEEDGNIFLEKIIDHIEAQDLPWTPLSPKTIARKGSSEIYIDSGFLKDNLEVRRIKSVQNGVTFFIGASAWKKTSSGVKLSDLMIWLEYGTKNIPPRPLIRPTWEEIEPILKDNWRTILQDLVEG